MLHPCLVCFQGMAECAAGCCERCEEALRDDWQEAHRAKEGG